MNIQKILEKHKIIPDPLKDQFFLKNDLIIKRMVELAELNKNDVVLEVGAGVGNLTRELAKYAGKVISLEIDESFKAILSDLPENVDMRFEDAWEYVQLHGKFWKKKEYNKVVSNLPYSFAEKFLHNLTFLIYDKAILLVPQSFANKIEDNPVFGSFFNVEEKIKVNKKKFYPIPKTNSAVIDLTKLPDPIETRNLPIFLRQFIYRFEQTKVKNSLREGLIKYVWLTKHERLTKNQARDIIKEVKIDERLLEKFPDNKTVYNTISKEFSKIEL